MSTRSPRFAIGLILATVMAAGGLMLADPASPVTISDVDSPDPVASGAQLTYTITMVNTAGSQVTNAVMTDQLNGVGGIGVPPQLQITSTRGTCTQSTNLVTCNAGTIEGGGSWTVTIRGVVTGAGGTTINNTASVTGTHTAQNFTSTTTASTLVSNDSGSPLPDLTISKTGPASVVVSSPMTYTLIVNNQGNCERRQRQGRRHAACGTDRHQRQRHEPVHLRRAGQTVTCLGGAVNQGANATITINGDVTGGQR